jgi:hypothetical protein
LVAILAIEHWCLTATLFNTWRSSWNKSHVPHRRMDWRYLPWDGVGFSGGGWPRYLRRRYGQSKEGMEVRISKHH